MGCGSSEYANLEDIRSTSSNTVNKPTISIEAAPDISTHTTVNSSQVTPGMDNKTSSTSGSKCTGEDLNSTKGVENSKDQSDKSLSKTTKWQTVNVEELMRSLNISIDDETVKWWDLVNHLVVRDTPVIKPHLKRKTWKTIRLFISSTFKDMSSEREVLVKGVVPALRQWCTERRLRLVECDLRWGVPKDSDTRETFLACLSEIDRCRDQNEYPYFLNMLSERYGSVMKPEEVPEDIKIRYKWLPGMSVTALEVFTGAYWERNPNALFMMRQPGFLNGVTDEDIRKVYQESDPGTAESLRVLKGNIREKYGDRTHDYSCHVEKTENGKLVLGGLEDFIVKVHDHFKACIERQYPFDSQQQQMTEVEVAYAEQEDFLLLRSQGLKGRDDIVDKISNYITSSVDSTCIMYLAGSAGAGKSSLMAASAKKAIENDKFKVFFHFVGATPDSTNSYSVLSRMFHECMPPNTVPPIDPDEMMRYTKTMFEKSTEYVLDQGYEKLVVYIDALNQMDDEGMAHKLGWLPRKLPKGMRLIVSTLEGTTLESMRSHEVQCNEVTVEPLNRDYRTNIAGEYLAEYNKLLDKEQMQLLVTKEDAGRPLYLAISCEELRVFGEFRKLTSKIQSLPGDLSGVIEIVLNRIIKEYGGDKVLSTLCLIETSRFGLSEAELVQLLAVEPLIPSSSSSNTAPIQFTGRKIHMAEWAFVYLGLHQFLRPCGGGSDDGRLDFYHRTSSKVVRQVFLKDEATKVAYHKRLAAFFKQCKDIARKCEELPYHLLSAQDWTELRAVLTDRAVFEHMSQDKHKQYLMKTWQQLGGYTEAAAAYTNFLKEHIESQNLEDTDEGYRLQTRVGWFMVDIGQYDQCLDLLYKVIEGSKKKYGEKAKELADPMYAVMTALYRKALTFVYNTHPGYRSSRMYGEKYAPQCETIHRLHWAPDDDYLGQVLVTCGYFKSSLLKNCREIFAKTMNKKGLSEVLYMLGEKDQYNSDIGVPESYFEQSQALCLASFGRYHLQTARCYQLYGQLYWNRWSSTARCQDWLEKCLALYLVELEILEEVQGKLHPNTVRSREDVIIILQNLNRHDEAKKYNQDQPADAKTIA